MFVCNRFLRLLILTVRAGGVPTRHTHTNKTAYIRGIYSRVHTHLLIKSLTLGKTTFASNLARRKLLRFSSFLSSRLLLSVFILFVLLPAAFPGRPAAPFTFYFLSVTALYSPIFPATRPARLISAFRSFLSAHQELWGRKKRSRKITPPATQLDEIATAGGA